MNNNTTLFAPLTIFVQQPNENHNFACEALSFVSCLKTTGPIKYKISRLTSEKLLSNDRRVNLFKVL